MPQIGWDPQWLLPSWGEHQKSLKGHDFYTE